MKKENELLKNAVKALKEQTGLTASYKNVQQAGSRSNQYIDADFDFYIEGKKINYLIEVKSQLNDAFIGTTAIEAKTNERLALVSEFITPSQAERMRDLNIPFFDTAGNVYLNEPGLLIYITGRKLKTSTERPIGLFSPAGVKLVLALITKPGLETFDYRTISHATGIPRTNIGRVMQGLEKAGFLIHRGSKGRYLTNKQNLIKRWVEAYSETYRLKLKPVRYHSTRFSGRWWEEMDVSEYNAVWGGETGGQHLTRYLKAQTATLYADSALAKLQARYGLVRDESGEVEILRRFWNFGEIKDTAPPLVVYADLVATADERNLDAARMVYDEYLAPLTEENSR